MSFLQENANLLWPVLLGFAGVFLLLPQARRDWRPLGALLAGAALIAGAALLVELQVVWPERLACGIFSTVAVAGALMMLTWKNPAHAALSFALVVVSTCGLFLLLGAPFLMAATLIIYAGAIVVTFLFVLMLAQQAGLSSADARSREPFLASLAGFALLAAVLLVQDRNFRRLDRVMEEVDRLVQAQDPADVAALLTEPGGEPTRLNRLVTDLKEVLPSRHHATIDNLEADWATADVKKRADKIQATCRKILSLGREQELVQGSLLIPQDVPVSTAGGVPGSQPPEKGPDGRVKERLAAANVAGLGRVLFTDYLIPIQMAAVLLLVATIGAIAIAGRRPEGLR